MFVLYLSIDGGSVMISERTRLASFEMMVDVAAAVYMKETLDEALVTGAIGQFVRKYKGSSFVLNAER